MTESIKMRFPADTEYIGTIRLALSGIAGKLDFALDDIEDLKSCVSEACLLILCGQECDGIDISIEVGGEIKVDVSGINVRPGNCGEDAGFNEEISRIMIEALSEDVKFEEEKGILTNISFSKKHSADMGVI